MPTCSGSAADATLLPDDVPPFGSRKLSEEEQVQRYQEMRDCPAAWRKLLDAHGRRQTVAHVGATEGRMRIGDR